MFVDCILENCVCIWGMCVFDLSNIFLYGGGLYSFFNNYDQDCLDMEDCQQNMVEVNNSQVILLVLVMKVSVSMLNVNGEVVVVYVDNDNNFCVIFVIFQLQG